MALDLSLITSGLQARANPAKKDNNQSFANKETPSRKANTYLGEESSSTGKERAKNEQRADKERAKNGQRTSKERAKNEQEYGQRTSKNVSEITPQHNTQKRHKSLKLRGNRLKLIQLCYELCKLNRSDTLEDMSDEFIAVNANMAIGSVKNTIKALVKDGYIERDSWSKGPGASRVLRLFDHVYQEMVELESRRRLGGIHSNTGKNTGNFFIYSSSSNTKTTDYCIPELWKDLDLSPLNGLTYKSKRGPETIRLTENSLKDIVKENVKQGRDLLSKNEMQ